MNNIYHRDSRGFLFQSIILLTITISLLLYFYFQTDKLFQIPDTIPYVTLFISILGITRAYQAVDNGSTGIQLFAALSILTHLIFTTTAIIDIFNIAISNKTQNSISELTNIIEDDKLLDPLQRKSLYRELAKNLKNLEKNLNKEEKALVQAVFFFIDKISTAETNYLKPLQEFRFLGLAPHDLSTKEDITKRRTLIKELIILNKKLYKTYKDSFKECKSKLSDFPQLAQKFNLLSERNIKLMHKGRELDHKYFTSSLKLIAILKKEWGKWEIKNSEFQFKSEKAAGLYNKEVEKIKYYILKMGELEDEIKFNDLI